MPTRTPTRPMTPSGRVNYWRPRDPKDYSPAKREFLALLNKAITAAGTINDLAQRLQMHPRKIQYWLIGVGPTLPAMERVAPTLKAIVAGR